MAGRVTQQTIDAADILDHCFRNIGNDELISFGKQLQHNTMLVTELCLENNSFGPEGVRALGLGLQQNTTLRILRMSHNNVGAEGATALGLALQFNATLTELDLDHTAIGNSGARALGMGLKLNSALIKLNLSSNHIGFEGASALGLTLQHNTTLESLILFDNNIGYVGATALAEGLAGNTALRYLNLFLTNIGDIGKTAFQAAMQKNTTMQLLILQEDRIPSIENCIARNNTLHMNQYWSPCLHIGFMLPCHGIIMTTLLCNRSTGNYPALPDHVWHLIFSFWMRKNFLIAGVHRL